MAENKKPFPVHAEEFKKRPKAKPGAKRTQVYNARPLREPLAHRNHPKDLPAGWQDKFLEELAMRPIVYKAAQAAGISRRTAERYRKEDPEFAEEWEAALEEANERVIMMCHEGAEAGDTTLRIFLAKAYVFGGADIGKPPIKDREKKITVGWEN